MYKNRAKRLVRQSVSKPPGRPQKPRPRAHSEKVKLDADRRVEGDGIARKTGAKAKIAAFQKANPWSRLLPLARLLKSIPQDAISPSVPVLA